MLINILGTEYEIITGMNQNTNEILKEADGYTDFSSKKMYVNEISEENGYE